MARRRSRGSSVQEGAGELSLPTSLPISQATPSPLPSGSVVCIVGHGTGRLLERPQGVVNFFLEFRARVGRRRLDDVKVVQDVDWLHGAVSFPNSVSWPTLLGCLVLTRTASFHPRVTFQLDLCVYAAWATTEWPMITQGDEFVSTQSNNSVMPRVRQKGWFERHRVTRKSLQRLITQANNPDV